INSRSQRSSKIKVGIATAAMLCGVLSFASTAAFADTIALTQNNLGISQTIGTVTHTQSATDQDTVKITMNSGFTITLQGGDVFFNSSIGLSASNSIHITTTA